MRASPARRRVLVAFAVVLSAWVGSQQANAGGAHSATKLSRSHALILGGRVRCTASVSSQVRVGHELRVKLALRNVSKRPVKGFFGYGSTWLVVKAAGGTTYDTRVANRVLSPPAPIPTKLRPGATRTLGAEVAVRWKGPLRITPGCVKKGLPRLHVAVVSPGPAPDETAAVNDVVDDAGHMLDQCRPREAGVPVDGEINPPTTGSAPPMSAQCSVSLTSEGSFWLAQVLVLIPAGLQGVTIQRPYELFGPPFGLFSTEPPPPPPYEAVGWQDVVTQAGAQTVAATTADATNDSPTSAMVPSYAWDGTTWIAAGTGTCGFHGWASGPIPTIDFISVCPF